MSTKDKNKSGDTLPYCKLQKLKHTQTIVLIKHTNFYLVPPSEIAYVNSHHQSIKTEL